NDSGRRAIGEPGICKPCVERCQLCVELLELCLCLATLLLDVDHARERNAQPRSTRKQNRCSSLRRLTIPDVAPRETRYEFSFVGEDRFVPISAAGSQNGEPRRGSFRLRDYVIR